MPQPKLSSVIRLRGVRHNNLKNIDLELPLNQLIVITGLSGSGKSSLAFDTLYAEGQRRYIETFSPYARQFFDRMDKPQANRIDGIPPAIAVEQRNAVKSTRSTVGTMTEICDYMKLLWPRLAQLHCRKCGQPVRKDSPQHIWETLTSAECRMRSAELLMTFDLPLSEKLSLDESLALISKQGYQRLLLNGEVIHLDAATKHSELRAPHSPLTVVQDRLKLAGHQRARFVEACEQAYHFGQGKLTVRMPGSEPSSTIQQFNDSTIQQFNDSTIQQFNDSTIHFSNRFHCARCDIEYREPSPALFSFNHPLGACPTCRGFGRIISIDYDLAIPDRSKTLAGGAIKPWQTGHGVECQADLMKFCKLRSVPTAVPFQNLPQKWREWVINGDPDYGKDSQHEWPRAWYGVKGYFRWLESKAYKMHIRVLLSRYRAYTPCPDCDGKRFQPESLLYRVALLKTKAPASDSLADFYALPIRDALQAIGRLGAERKFKSDNALGLVLNEVQSRLGYLNDVGLGYLTLDRPTRSLSGGETERVNLTACLGTRLVNTLFVLDEPSVGLHPCDTARLVRILQRLRDTGNTVVVVEHEAGVIRAADRIVDLGPGHGATGGQVVFQGSYPEILKSTQSLTGQYLSGRKQIAIPSRRFVTADAGRLAPYPAESGKVRNGVSGKRRGPATSAPALRIINATRHNLKNLSVEIPLTRFVCISGVSGSGKSTLVREVLYPALQEKLKTRIANLECETPEASGRIKKGKEDEQDESRITHHAASIEGAEQLANIVLVDQSSLGKTPRSNPAVYVGAFDDIRELFAQSELALQRGLNASAFSFNSSQGQCERCRGAGFEKIEMQFLSDVFIRCPDCNGRRYRPHILEVKVNSALRTRHSALQWSIADLLEATVEEVINFLSGWAESRPARRAVEGLKLLQEVGLGYLRLGQPINTLSGGESQRLKLVRHLAEAGQHGSGAGEKVGKWESEMAEPHSAAVPPAHFGQLREESLECGEGRTLFLFDEPTTGLHFDDVRVLLRVFQRLVDAGHSLIVIEHNLDVIKSADWIIDLGPEAGDEGGKIVAQGTPEKVAACRASHTGKALRTRVSPHY